ncbi:MAG: hypothetical protein AB1633_01110 [Elusimicrobiota bacterium]
MIAISSFNGHERRKFVRVHEPVNVKFRVIGKSTADLKKKIFFSEWFNAISCNVGRGGLCLEVPAPLKAIVSKMAKPVNMIEVEVDLPVCRRLMVGEKVNCFRALGSLVWKNMSHKKNLLRAGIRFLKASDESERLIGNYIIERYIQKYGNSE